MNIDRVQPTAPTYPASTVKNVHPTPTIDSIPFKQKVANHLNEPAGPVLGQIALAVMIACMVVACVVIRG